MITKKLLRDWEACWNDQRIATYFGKRTKLTPREIAADESITLDDRLWVMCRAIWYLDECAARLYAIESASLVAHLAGDEDDQAIYAGLMNDMIQIEDLPVEARDAARAEARAAARAAAWDAARAEARAGDAAWDAARAAAWAAARDAARDAAWYAAWAAAQQKAIDRAINWLGDYADGWEES